MEKRDKLKILAAGDLHGNSKIAERLAEKARKNKVDLVVLLGDIHGAIESKNLISPFKKANQKVVFIPGNWDTKLEADSIRDSYDIKNLDGYYASYKNVGIIGIGNSGFERLKKNFDKLKKKDVKKRILISHLHAAGTKAEFSGFPGSLALRKAIDYFHPEIFLQAHIHEAEGIEETIGKTRVINVGRSGKIIEL